MFKRLSGGLQRQHGGGGGDWSAFPVRQLFVLGMSILDFRPSFESGCELYLVRQCLLAAFFLSSGFLLLSIHDVFDPGCITDSLTSMLPNLRANCVYVHFSLCLSHGRIIPRDRQ